MASNEEILPVVDEDGSVIFQAPRSQCHDGTGRLLHPVVHLHIIDDLGRIALQKRSLTKKIQPGRWDTVVGGHVSFGETIPQSLAREVKEETGLTEFTPELLQKYIFTSPVERELVYSFVCRVHRDTNLRVEPGEAEEIKFWTADEIRSNIGSGIFTPNFEKEFNDLILPFLNDK